MPTNIEYVVEVEKYDLGHRGFLPQNSGLPMSWVHLGLTLTDDGEGISLSELVGQKVVVSGLVSNRGPRNCWLYSNIRRCDTDVDAVL